jgi:hypothetical protein
MKVGVALNMLYEHGKHDAAVVHEHLAEGDLVEPLGFNSLWALEHHFNGEFFQIPKMSIRISAPSTIPRRSRPRGKPLRMSACPGCTSARARGRRSTASTEWSSKQQQQTSSVIASVTDVRSGDAPADPTDFPRLPETSHPMGSLRCRWHKDFGQFFPVSRYPPPRHPRHSRHGVANFGGNFFGRASMKSAAARSPCTGLRSFVILAEQKGLALRT